MAAERAPTVPRPLTRHEHQAQRSTPVAPPRVLTPAEIYAELERYVIGQQRAKRKIAIAAYNHAKRVAGAGTTGLIRKSNILLYGPTGCGKTHLARHLAHILEVPFIVVDATDFTEAGYYGKDVETIIGELLLQTESIEAAQRGIVFVDEVDKIAARSGGARTGAGNRDIGGEGVQQALLKLLEGKVIYAPVNVTQHWNKHDFVPVDVTDVLFICAGAFSDLGEGTAPPVDGFSAPRRASPPAAPSLLDTPAPAIPSAGDDPPPAAAAAALDSEPRPRRITTDQLRRYGFSPEFLGRLPVRVGMSELTSAQLQRVLVEPPDAIVKEYRALLEMDGVHLSWTADAFEPVAEYARREKLGARVLRTVMEEVFEDVMFDAPQLRGRTIEVTREDVAARLATLDDGA